MLRDYVPMREKRGSETKRCVRKIKNHARDFMSPRTRHDRKGRLINEVRGNASFSKSTVSRGSLKSPSS